MHCYQKEFYLDSNGVSTAGVPSILVGITAISSARRVDMLSETDASIKMSSSTGWVKLHPFWNRVDAELIILGVPTRQLSSVGLFQISKQDCGYLLSLWGMVSNLQLSVPEALR